MGFLKTLWTDRSAPKITAAQLNRIEQGVADAHGGLASLAAYARVSSSAGQSIPNSVNTPLTFATEDFDLTNIHAPGSSTFVIKLDGVYIFGAAVEFANYSAGRRGLYLRVNGGILTGHQMPGQIYVAATAAVGTPFVVGDSLDVVAFQDSGAAQPLNTNAWSSHMWLVRLGAR